MKISEEKKHILKLIKCSKFLHYLIGISEKKGSLVFEVNVREIEKEIGVSVKKSYSKLCLLAESDFISFHISSNLVMVGVSKEIGNDY